MRTSIVSTLRARGFDRSFAVPFRHEWQVGCSQCEALAICGIPCHETGCPNATRECKGCDARVPSHVDYCHDCR